MQGRNLMPGKLTYICKDQVVDDGEATSNMHPHTPGTEADVTLCEQKQQYN